MTRLKTGESASSFSIRNASRATSLQNRLPVIAAEKLHQLPADGIAAHQPFTGNESGENSTLLVRNMVSSRCIIVTRAVLESFGLKCLDLRLGEAVVAGAVSRELRELLHAALSQSGLGLIDDKKEGLVEKIKQTLIGAIYSAEEFPRQKISTFLSEKLNYNYTYLANVFSEVTGSSIRDFIIRHKIERVKELLFYEDVTLSQIAFDLHYSSVAHLSNQFRKSTGQTPSHFRMSRHKKLTAIEEV